MRFRIDPLVVQIRFYDVEVDSDKPLCETDTPYSHIVTGIILDNGLCRISGMDSPVHDRSALIKEFKRMGVNTVEWRHKGEHSFKIGTGKVHDDYNPLDVWFL